MSTIAQGMGDVRSRMPQWLLGMLLDRSSNDEIRTAINKTPQVQSVYTITVDTVTNSATYTWTVGEAGREVTLSITADASATDAEISAAITDAINEDPIARGQCTAVNTSATVVTVTGNWPGVEVVVSDSDAKLTSAQVTAAASADAIAFGRAVIKTGQNNADEQVALAKSSLFTAQVQTHGIAYVASSVITIRVYEVRGSERELIAQVDEASATSQDATIDALVVLLNAALPANSVLAAADNASATAIVFTAEVAGLEIDVEILAGHEGASLPALTKTNTTGPSESTSFHRAFRGVSLHSHAAPAATIGGSTGQYAGNAGLSYVRRGTVAVDSSESITSGDTAYVELGVTADNGKFFNSDSATRIKVARDRARWERDGDSGTATLAALRVSA